MKLKNNIQNFLTLFNHTKLFTNRILLFIVFSGFFLTNCCIVNMLGGSSGRKPSELKMKISTGGRALIKDAFKNIDSSKLIDYHSHLVGLGKGNTGLFVNPEMHSCLHPYKRMKFHIYMSGSGIKNIEKADQQYITRMTDMISHIENAGKYHILAFDKNYRRNGNVDLTLTEFYVPNEYVFKIAKKYPDYFIPTISINPYRKDALIELEKWAKKGARFIKWLPNSMGINPSDKKIEPYYRMMKKYNMVLLSHAGEEAAVDAKEAQKLGNPLLLRKPLDMGVKVIVAHCASLGKNIDSEKPGNREVENFDLFMRLMDEKKYDGLLFGDISAITQANRLSHPLKTIILRRDLHHRLVNGSDYPLPAINIVIRTRSLLKEGFINKKEREFLNEIFDYNPLLFDFVVKRIVKAPGTNKKLSASIFMVNPGL